MHLSSVSSVTVAGSPSLSSHNTPVSLELLFAVKCNIGNGTVNYFLTPHSTFPDILCYYTFRQCKDWRRIKIRRKDVVCVLYAVKNGSKNRQVRIRRCALFLLVFFIAVLLIAQVTVIINANHECIGDGCPICKLIRNAENLIKQIGRAVISISVLHAALFFMATGMIIGGLVYAAASTPINTKARLNF